MRVTRHGHACLLVETDATRILVDPGFFSADAAFEERDLDAVVVTHQHADHADPERLPGLLGANPKAALFADPETASGREEPWFAHHDGDVTQVGDIRVQGVGRLHAPIVPTMDRITNTGVLLSTDGGHVLFHPGDTYEYAPADVDVLALPLSAPWAKIAETVDFVDRVNPSLVFPIHDGTIADRAYDVYWGHVATHGGVDDARRLVSGETLDLARL